MLKKFGNRKLNTKPNRTADIVMVSLIALNMILSILSMFFINYEPISYYVFNIVIGLCFLIHRYYYIGSNVVYRKGLWLAAVLIN